MSAPRLDFEKGIAELEQQIERLEELARERGLDVSKELGVLEEKLEELKRQTYANLTAIERVQLARHPRRPYTLDYIERTPPVHGTQGRGQDVPDPIKG